MAKKIVTWIVILSFLSSGSAFGRGGGGRGGGGFHGGFGAGGFGGAGGFHSGGFGGGFGGGFHSEFNRSPSMSMPRGDFGRGDFGRSGSYAESRGNFGRGANMPDRPAANSAFQNRTNFQNFGNRTNVGDRTNFQNFGNRTNIGDRTNIGNIGDRTNIGNIGNRTNLNINRPITNNFGNLNRINYGDWHHGYWHGNWNNWNHWGWNHYPVGWGWWGAAATGALFAAAIPWGWGYYGYSNPYYLAPAVADGSYYDYSQPILATSAPAGGAAVDGQPSATDLASQAFENARQAFMAGDYTTALAQIDQAIASVPNDPTLHEFRGVTLFALGRYQEAAGVMYAVLSSGPGWDWTTLSSLYPDTDTYTNQLRGLEAYRRDHPDEANARFLLAYFYMTAGQTEAAERELKAVVKINPKDQLSAQLLASLEQPADGQTPPAATEPSTPAAPAKPVNAAGLVGNWKATQGDGTSIALNLSKDSKYTWTVNRGGKAEDHSGTYTVADNLLILNQDGNPAMVGQVTQSADRSFNFRLPGAPQADPGLTFSKSAG